MLKKINNKGFTLIELLVTIIILGVVFTVSIVAVTGSYQSSKDKAYEAFVEQIKGYIDDYITLNSSKFEYDYFANKNKCYKDFEGNDVCSSVEVYFSDSYFIENISSVTSKELINPKSNKPCLNDNTKLTVYRDSDYVYCFIIEKNNENSCIENTINTCSSIYKDW